MSGIKVRKSRRRSESCDPCGICAFGVVIFGICAAVFGIISFFYSTISVALPKCSVVGFYVPALNKTIVGTNASDVISFTISFKDSNNMKGVQYSPVNLTFYYGSDNSFLVGNYVVPSFYQASILARGASYFPIEKSSVVSTHDVPWKAARDLTRNGSTVSFRVGLDTTVRNKYMDMILNRKRKMTLGATVKVDDSGNKVGKSVDFKKWRN
jgi:hypothetical protein